MRRIIPLIALAMLALASPCVAQTRPAPAPAVNQLDLNTASRDDLMTLEGIG